MTLPKHYQKNCNQTETSIECRAIMHKDCPSTCLYSQQIAGVEGMTYVSKGLVKKAQDAIEEAGGSY